ncbi:pheromone-binding protein-related protein 6-like [Copidosoma floridanum]|uniref:pheromone-binding protein-related protein 6-like n=1 Tax=Copidosoma floridanum TaxID=29053 RepID=UPI0006C94240|nr:pheromone-binding protein-related protein 6-like [Copidosoma floridanum]XP_014213666.1 pheromone-binding protein-related protein 6-like [Copidosoma floridanum]
MVARVLSVVVLVCCLQAVFVSAGKRPDFVTDEMMEIVRPDKEKCMAEHGTTEDLIDEVNDGHLQDNRAITCYMHCLFEAFSLIDDDGELEVEMLVGFIPEEFKAVAEDLIEHCAHLKGTDPCNTMFVMAKCVQDKRPDLWFMV